MANISTANITDAAQTNVEMGLMRVGDANNNNIVNTQDFTILKSAFVTSNDARADFNNDGTVSTADFNLLRNNLGQSGAPPADPVGRRRRC